VTFSQQVSWWSVHEYVAPALDAAGRWPAAGSPQWRALPDGHPAKVAALLDAARHWALRVETCQQALGQASRDVSGAADWRALANQIRHRRQAYIPRETAS
jgi:hypothetical protein